MSSRSCNLSDECCSWPVEERKEPRVDQISRSVNSTRKRQCSSVVESARCCYRGCSEEEKSMKEGEVGKLGTEAVSGMTEIPEHNRGFTKSGEGNIEADFLIGRPLWVYCLLL